MPLNPERIQFQVENDEMVAGVYADSATDVITEADLEEAEDTEEKDCGGQPRCKNGTVYAHDRDLRELIALLLRSKAQAMEDEAVHNIPEASHLSGVAETVIHKLINRYHYISPPRLGEYNKQPTHLLRPSDMQWLEVYVQLTGQGYKPREIVRLKVVYEYERNAVDMVWDVVDELSVDCIGSSSNETPDLLRRARERLLDVLLYNPLLDERDTEALWFIREKLDAPAVAVSSYVRGDIAAK